MARAWTILAALLAGAAWAQPPAYTAAGIVNAADYTPGPFAPNSVLSVFGSNLAWSEQSLKASDIIDRTLPRKLNGVEVYVDNWPAPLFYVSPTQINFILPGNEIPGGVAVRVVREGLTGPEVTVTLVDAAPALFAWQGYAIVTHVDGSLLAESAPAQGGETVVVYATGMGKTQPNPAPGAIPQTAASIVALDSLKVYLDGVAVDPIHLKYAGVTPQSAGLYQINLELPANAGTDPEIRVAVGTQTSLAGMKLVVR